jgi:hypothetical protein
MTVLVEKPAERLADERAAAPVDDLGRGPPERLVGIGARQRTRHPRQARAEAESLPPRVCTQRRVREHDEGARVVRHRARDVEEQDEAAPAAAALAPGTLQRLAARAKGSAQRTAEVG